LTSTADDDGPPQIRFVEPKDGGPTPLLLLLLLLEEVVSDVPARPGMLLVPVAVGHTSPLEPPPSTLAQDPPAMCDDADPADPTADMDIATGNRPDVESALTERSFLHILLTFAGVDIHEVYAVLAPPYDKAQNDESLNVIRRSWITCLPWYTENG